MTPGEKAIGALVVVFVVVVATALLVNLALAATHMVERRREQRRVR